MAKHTFEDLFLHQIRDLHSAERQLIEALPKMAKGAKNPELRKAFEAHLEETKEHKNRLERILEQRGVRPGRTTCKGMKGLIEEGKEVLDDDWDGAVGDAGIIGAAQRVEHYEMAGYGTARAFAERLGDSNAVKLLEATLREEKAADRKLSQLAESSVNARAELRA